MIKFKEGITRERVFNTSKEQGIIIVYGNQEKFFEMVVNDNCLPPEDGNSLITLYADPELANLYTGKEIDDMATHSQEA